jgi:hypothetical protein
MMPFSKVPVRFPVRFSGLLVMSGVRALSVLPDDGCGTNAFPPMDEGFEFVAMFVACGELRYEKMRTEELIPVAKMRNPAISFLTSTIFLIIPYLNKSR